MGDHSRRGRTSATRKRSVVIGTKSRVLLAIGAYPPAHGGGGLRAHRTYKQILEYLPIDLTVVTHCHGDQLPGWSEFDGVPVLSVAPEIRKFAFLQACHALAKANRLRPFDLVHVMGQSSISWKIMMAARWLRIPTIFEFTLLPQLSPSGDRRTRSKLRCLQWAQLAIALNEQIAQRYLTYGVPPDRIWQRPNPVRTDLFHSPSAAERQRARAELNLGDNDLMALVLARVRSRKNQLLAVEALSHLPAHYKLVLAGPVRPEDQPYFTELQRVITEKNLTHRVKLVTEQVEQVAPLYHAADCFWLTSLKEGLPNVMLESLCAGVPVVANRVLELAAYIHDGVNGRNADSNPTAFAQAALALEPVMRDGSRRDSIARDARERFDAKRINREFAARLGTILGIGYDTGSALALGDSQRTEARM